ncbi:hypothetical protein L1887_14691 [Cichorium endivia]|nr:hypothetical protein L1887_14691 [Cichorium endivia]
MRMGIIVVGILVAMEVEVDVDVDVDWQRDQGNAGPGVDLNDLRKKVLARKHSSPQHEMREEIEKIPKS